jgi:hypothetical protein
MRTHLFLIFGYGVPDNIGRDLNYQVYLRVAFNTIYQATTAKNITPYILVCGGPTDLVRPYRRTEAGEMVQVFRKMFRKVPTARRRGWKISLEPHSISTLENFQNTLSAAKRTKTVTIFCEATRAPRIRRLARRIYDSKITSQVIGVDFDASANRFLDPKFLRRKENAMERFDVWALKSSRNFRQHHLAYAEKLKRFRASGSRQHIRSVKDWWESVLEEFSGAT